MQHFSAFRLRAACLLSLTLCSACPAALGQLSPTAQTLLVMPFENRSSAPGLEWIAESFPEVLSQRMASGSTYAMGRADRAYAFDRSGIPATVFPSRATLYHIAERMGADYVVLGSYNFDGKTFSATAQLLDMKKLHLYPAVESNGPLTDLIRVQTVLAWLLLQQMPAHSAATREQFLTSWPPIRLDAFENYLRGVLASDRQQKIHYLHDAIKLDPNYTLAMLELGKTYFNNHEYESAAAWLARVPRTDSAAGEANFLLGMSEFYRGNFDKAFAAFSYLLTRLPLPEVYNNVGVVEARRGHHAAAVESFTKAVNADPNDADYHFNLALALIRNGDSAAASRQLKEELQRHPGDGEARSLLELIARLPSSGSSSGASNSLLAPAQPRLPLERIKRNYDEASYRELELEVSKFNEARLAGMNNQDHAAYHLKRGQELLAQEMIEQAENEFHEAIRTDPDNAAAHAQLAMLLEQKGATSDARLEAQNSARLKPNVDALLVLARLDMKQGQFQAAASEVQRALALEPSNVAAQALKSQIAARQTGAQ